MSAPRPGMLGTPPALMPGMTPGLVVLGRVGKPWESWNPWWSMPGGILEKSKLPGGGGGGGRPWPGPAAIGGGGSGICPLLSIAWNWSGSIPDRLRVPGMNCGGGGTLVGGGTLFGTPFVAPGFAPWPRPGIPGRIGVFAGIFWSTSPSASSSTSCSSSASSILRPDRLSQVPWASAAASPIWYLSLKQSLSPGLARDQKRVTLSFDPDAMMWPRGCQARDQTAKSCAYWSRWAGHIVCAGVLEGSALSYGESVAAVPAGVFGSSNR